MSDIKENPEEAPNTTTDESETLKKVKTENSKSDINLLEEVNQTSQSPIQNPQDQNVVPRQSSEININQSALKDSQKRSSRKKEKPNSVSIGEVLKTEYTNDPASYVDTYQELKYKDYIYKLNDNLLIRNESDSTNDFVCKLTRIIRPLNLDSATALAFLEVQWYYKKNDLPRKQFSDKLNFISENEVFLTNQKDFVMVDCINGLGTVLSYEEYDSLPRILLNTYYSRAKYDANKKKMFPPTEKWPKHCICRSPLNPDYMYIQCDICKMWFHLACLNMSTEEAEAMETYSCIYCEDKGDNIKETPNDEKNKLNETVNRNTENEGNGVDPVNEANSPPTSTSENKSQMEIEKADPDGDDSDEIYV